MTDSLTTVLRAALPPNDSGVVHVSRLSSPELRRALTGYEVKEVPAVRGRAVWPDVGAGVSVCEWPGWIGQLETQPTSSRVCVVESGSRPEWACDFMIVNGPGGYHIAESGWIPDPVAQTDYANRTSQTRLLVAQLTQARGVTIAWPVHSPRTLLLLPIDPAPGLQSVPAPPGLAVTPLEGFPEFPGGLAIHLRVFIDRFDLRSWAAEFTAAITSGEQKT